MNSIRYIENNLSRISELEMLEKFDLLLSSAYVINSKDLHNAELVKDLLSKIAALRYEMAYNKGIESISFRLDKILAYESLSLARIIFKGNDLINYISDVLYYEINDGMKEELQKEMSEIHR